jgi:hypothetical protein
MMISLRNALVWNKPMFVEKSLCKTGSSSAGFSVNGLGNMPTDVTIMFWYKITGVTSSNIYNKSRCAFKYGNVSTGIGFGAAFWGGSGTHVGLVEGRYWNRIDNGTIPVFDDNWHHVSLAVRSGTAPFANTVYIDGILGTQYEPSTNAFYNPIDSFYVCGRATGDGLGQPCFVYNMKIFNGIASQRDVLDDIRRAGKYPPNDNLLHHWTGDVVDGKVADNVGNWHLTISQDCEIVSDTPFSA